VTDQGGFLAIANREIQKEWEGQTAHVYAFILAAGSIRIFQCATATPDLAAGSRG